MHEKIVEINQDNALTLTKESKITSYVKVLPGGTAARGATCGLSAKPYVGWTVTRSRSPSFIF